MKQRLAILAIIILFGALGTASATVVGTLLTGSGGTITVTNFGITWNPDPNPGPPWNGEVATGTFLSFGACASPGALGSAGCLTAGEGIDINFGGPLGPPPITILPENFFLVFQNHPLLDFKLVDVLPGSLNTSCSTLLVNQSCSPFLGSPIILTLLSGNRTSAVLNFDGLASDNAGATFNSNWVGGFSATIVNTTPGALQALFCPGGPPFTPPPAGTCNSTGSISTSNSGSFFVTAVGIPEPGSLVLIGGGLIGLATLLRRRKSA